MIDNNNNFGFVDLMNPYPNLSFIDDIHEKLAPFKKCTPAYREKIGWDAANNKFYVPILQQSTIIGSLYRSTIGSLYESTIGGFLSYNTNNTAPCDVPKIVSSVQPLTDLIKSCEEKFPELLAQVKNGGLSLEEAKFLISQISELSKVNSCFRAFGLYIHEEDSMQLFKAFGLSNKLEEIIDRNLALLEEALDEKYRTGIAKSDLRYSTRPLPKEVMESIIQFCTIESVRRLAQVSYFLNVMASESECIKNFNRWNMKPVEFVACRLADSHPPYHNFPAFSNVLKAAGKAMALNKPELIFINNQRMIKSCNSENDINAEQFFRGCLEKDAKIHSLINEAKGNQYMLRGEKVREAGVELENYLNRVEVLFAERDEVSSENS